MLTCAVPHLANYFCSMFPIRAGWSVRHHSFVSYCLYTIGFVVFVMSLKARR